LIEAHILEVELKDEQRHGVNFENIMNFGGNSIRLQMIGLATAAAPQAFFAEINGAGLTSLIEFLKSTTDAKTLASPKVLVVNGQTARIQVGEKLGFLTSNTTQTSTQQNVSFLNVGVLFEVTPRVTPDNRVLMHVKPEVSTGRVNPDTGLPEAKTTEVATDVMLGDGNGIVIGGLIQETDIETQNKLPFLGDIKYIGRLFQRRVYAKRRTEIIMTLVAHVLPYCPEIEQREAMELMRTQTPILHGPLERYPRPFEPSLRDAVRNPVIFRLPPIVHHDCSHSRDCRCHNCCSQNADNQPTAAVPNVYVAPPVARFPAEGQSSTYETRIGTAPTSNSRR
jgi:type IV pilus assembly protein PilQ